MTKWSVGIDADRYVTATFTDDDRTNTVRSDKPIPAGNAMRVSVTRGPDGAPRIDVDPPVTA